MGYTRRSRYVPATGAVAPSASPGSLGGGIVDLAGNQFGIGPNGTIYQVSTGGGAASWIFSPALLPASDNPADHNVQIDLFFTMAAGAGTWLMFRSINPGNNSTGAGYIMGWNGSALQAYSYVGSTLTAATASSGTVVPAPANGVLYRLRGKVEQTNGTTTTLACVITLASDPSVRLGDAFVWTDTTSALQNITGRLGFFQSVNAPYTYGTPGTISQVDYYDDLSSATGSIYVDNPALHLSPYGWKVTGSGSASRADSTLPGTYIDAVVNGAIGTLGLLVDGTANQSATSGALPVIAWRLNGGPIATATLGTTNAVYAIDLTATSTLLTGTNDILKVWFKAGSIADDRSATTRDHLVIQGLSVDSGATLGAYVPAADVAIGFGDSITEGVGVESIFADWTHLDPNTSYKTWLPLACAALGAEYGQIGSGGQAMGTVYSGNLDPCTTAWKYYTKADTRLVSGLYSPQPKHVFCNHGTNDTSDPTSAYNAWLAGNRAAAPSAHIWLIVPVSGRWRSQITAVVTAAQAAGDSKVHLIDPAFMNAFCHLLPPATTLTFDGVHPIAYAQALLGAFVVQKVQATLGGVGVTISTDTFLRLRNALASDQAAREIAKAFTSGGSVSTRTLALLAQAIA